MSFSRQKELLADLSDFRNKLSRDEEYIFQMAIKRHKDDEELDVMTLQKLEEMHKKYVVRKPKFDPNKFFKNS